MLGRRLWSFAMLVCLYGLPLPIAANATESQDGNRQPDAAVQVPAQPFSRAVQAGDFVFASGQIGVSRDGRQITMAEESRRAMNNVQAALATVGAGMDDVVKCTVMLTDMSQWEEFNRVYVDYFKKGHLPARSAFGATALAYGARAEVECIAYRPKRD